MSTLTGSSTAGQVLECEHWLGGCVRWASMDFKHEGKPRAACARDDRVPPEKAHIQRRRRTSSGIVPAVAPDPTGAPTAERLDILVVDGERTGAAMHERVERLGHPCRMASSVAQALHMHEGQGADVIICGRGLRPADAFELCRRVRALRRRKYTYLLLVGTTTRDVDAAARAGADAWLDNPVERLELEARLMVASRICRDYDALADTNAVLRRDSRVFLHAARVDALTGIPNRLRLDEDLETLQAHVSRYGQKVSIAMCDVDRFKLLNDSYGHVAGDDALRHIARAARESLRRGDQVYRFGGDEFLVLLPEQGRVQAGAAMERVRAAVEALRIAHAPEARLPIVTISIGLAVMAGGTRTVQEAIMSADRALYRAKGAGGNSLAFEPGPHTLAGDEARSTRLAGVPNREPS